MIKRKKTKVTLYAGQEKPPRDLTVSMTRVGRSARLAAAGACITPPVDAECTH